MTVVARTAAVLSLLALVVTGAACNSTAKKAPRAKPIPIVSRPMPEVLTNTVGAFGQINGLQPAYVSGYGIVVGLNGTGAADVPLSVRAALTDEMLRNGVGKRGTALADVTPDQMIDDPNTAVVLVQALIPPAAPKGTRFDVRVSALPGSSVTSLEGGTLYTTELRRGTPIPNGPQTFKVAEARGPILINPMSPPLPAGSTLPNDGIVRTQGRVLSGGAVNSPFRPTFRLDNPSHARARTIANAINARFPQRSNRYTTARGVNEDSIELNVPQDYLREPETFFSLVLHTRVDQSFTEEWASRYVGAIEREPVLSDRVGWALEALGEPAVPFLRRLYDSAERGPRQSSLRVGARLRDPLTGPHLEELSTSGPITLRTEAIKLLGHLPHDRRIDLFLSELLNDDDLSIRIAAYEALDQRGDPRFFRAVYPDAFVLYVVPADKPMIFFTQQGDPTIVLFSELEIEPGSFASGWDDRLMVDATGRDSADGARIFYQDHRTGRSKTHVQSRSVRELINYFVHEETPDEPWPGLGMSYSEVVGALHELTRGGAIDADFVAENDRLQLDFLRAARAADAVDRPELSEEGPIAALDLEESGVSVLSTDAGDRDRRDRDRDDDWEDRRSRYIIPGPAVTPPAGSGDEAGG